jgi:hypothetical protein
MMNPTARPIRRPMPTIQPAAATPTLVRAPRDSSIFGGWGVRI